MKDPCWFLGQKFTAVTCGKILTIKCEMKVSITKRLVCGQKVKVPSIGKHGL